MHTIASITKTALFFMTLTAVLLGWPVQNVHAQGNSHCELVRGTGFVSVDLSMWPEMIGLSGDISGDIEGTLSAFRHSVDGTEQQGQGATFGTYPIARLETDRLGDFTGTGRSTFNFATPHTEGVRTTTGIFWAFFDEDGWLQAVAEFDLSGDFPAAHFDYQAELCPSNA